MTLEFTSDNFEKEVLAHSGAVLVDFWAPWCGPCKMIAPIIDEIAADFKDKDLKVGKLNVDEQPALASQFAVMSIPTMIVFKGGTPVGQLVGAQSKDKIVEKIEAVLGDK